MRRACDQVLSRNQTGCILTGMRRRQYRKPQTRRAPHCGLFNTNVLEPIVKRGVRIHDPIANKRAPSDNSCYQAAKGALAAQHMLAHMSLTVPGSAQLPMS